MISVDKAAWRDELALHTQLFEKLALRLPPQLPATRDSLEARLKS